MAREPIDWSRIAAEGAAIVVSILLAFAIDAGWELRGDRARERSYLERLRVEFRDNRADLIADQMDRDSIIAEFAFLLRATSSPADVEPIEIGRRLSNLAGSFRFYAPSHPVLTELVSSGDLGLLRSDSLRHALLKYDEVRSELAGVEESEQAIQRMVVVPYLAQRIEVLPWLRPAQLEMLDLSPSASQDPREWVQDEAFQNMIVMRWQRARTVQSYSAPVLDQIDRVLGLLDRLLG